MISVRTTGPRFRPTTTEEEELMHLIYVASTLLKLGVHICIGNYYSRLDWPFQ